MRLGITGGLPEPASLAERREWRHRKETVEIAYVTKVLSMIGRKSKVEMRRRQKIY